MRLLKSLFSFRLLSNNLVKKYLQMASWSVLVFGVVLYLGLLTWVGVVSSGSTPSYAEAVLVLGAQAHFPAGRWNPCLVARVKRGVELVQTGFATQLILSGGVDEKDGAVEALIMQDMALSFGLTKNQLRLEKRSTSTAENLRFSKPLLSNPRVIIVSDPFHLARAGALAQKLKLQPVLIGAPKSPCWSRFGMLSRFALREPLALIQNWLRGDL
jgi:uncharacterized SAM-binding protein YcdF (DUF218 family)